MDQKKLGIIATVGIGGCLTFACIGALALLGVGQVWKEVTGSKPQVGAAAPDFELTSLQNEVLHLSDFQGQPVVLSFSATWCPPCQEEAPMLQELHENYALKVLVVDSKESYDTVSSYAEENLLSYTFLLDYEGDVAHMYQAYSIPAVFFIDAQGIVRAQYIGLMEEDDLADGLEAIHVAQQ